MTKDVPSTALDSILKGTETLQRRRSLRLPTCRLIGNFFWDVDHLREVSIPPAFNGVGEDRKAGMREGERGLTRAVAGAVV